MSVLSTLDTGRIQKRPLGKQLVLALPMRPAVNVYLQFVGVGEAYATQLADDVQLLQCAAKQAKTMLAL